MTEYTIDQTVPTTYINKRGLAVQGYVVYFTLLEFGETHMINVESLSPTAIDKAIQGVLSDRRALQKLGTKG